MGDIDAIYGGAPAEPQPAPAEPVAPQPEQQKAAEPSAQSQFDESAYLTELTGGMAKSREEFVGIIERAKAADEVDALREQLRTAHPNEFTKSIAEMVSKGASPEQLKTFIDLSLNEDISKMDDYDALIKAAYLKESDVLTADDAKLLVESKYPKSAEDLAFEKGLSDEEAERQFRLLDIERRKEIKQAREFLNNFKKSVYENVVSNGDKRIETIEKAWQPTVPVIGKQLAAESVKLEIADDKAGINTTFEVKLPQEFVEKVMETIPKWAANAGLEVNTKNSELIINEAKKAYIANNYNQIIESAIRDTWAKATKRMEEEFSNPNKPGKPSGQPMKAESAEFADLFYQ